MFHVQLGNFYSNTHGMKTIKIMAIYIHKILCGHYIEQFSHRLLQKPTHMQNKRMLSQILPEKWVTWGIS
jgi:hypothetical protein